MVANAVERFSVRLRNTGFTDARHSLHVSKMPPHGGVRRNRPAALRRAANCRRDFPRPGEFWNAVLEVPRTPHPGHWRIGQSPGPGRLCGDIHTAILKASGLYRIFDERRGSRTAWCTLNGHSVVCRQCRRLARIRPHFEVGAPSLWVGDGSRSRQTCCTGTVTASYCAQRIAAEVPAVAAELHCAEQKIINFAGQARFPWRSWAR